MWGDRFPSYGYSLINGEHNDDMESYRCGQRVGADFCNSMYTRIPNADNGFDKF